MKKGINVIVFCFLCLMLIITPEVYAGGKKRVSKDERYQTLQRLKQLETQVDSIPETTILELNEIIKTSIEKEWKDIQQNAYLLTGRAYKLLDQPQLALYYLEEARKINDVGVEANKSLDKAYDYIKPEMKSKEAISKSEDSYGYRQDKSLPDEYYQEMAEVYQILDDYKKSNQYYEQLLIQQDKSTRRTDIEYAIADNYFRDKQYKKAMDAYNSLLEYENELGDKERIEFCNSRIAACFISLGETKKGVSYYNNSFQQVQEVPNADYKISEEELSIGFDNTNMEEVSQALRDQGKYEEEVDFRNENYAITGNELKSIDQLKIAQSYYGAEEYAKCEQSLDQFFKDIDYNIIDREEIAVIKDMAILLEEEERFKKALEYFHYYETIIDSIESQVASLEDKTESLGQEGVRNIIEMEKLRNEKEVSKRTITYLMREGELQVEVVEAQRYLIYLLCAIILIGLLSVLYILRVSKQRRIANQQLAMRSLRSQMNPHFIFNALNSVNAFISVSNERDANRFLTEFSTLMRTVMENSEEDFIPLSKEMEIIKIYLELEHFRFKDKFSYELIVDENLDEDQYVIPPMLVQPYIENAIWHGLRYKETEGKLLVKIQEEGQGVMISIQDDGIGRKASQELKTKNQRKFKSTALRNIDERMKIFKEMYGLNLQIATQDLNENGTGTVVTIHIPQQTNG